MFGSTQLNRVRLVTHVRHGCTATRRLGTALLNLVFPPRCARCTADLPPEYGSTLCEECSRILAPEVWSGCPRCGAAIPESDSPVKNCPSCQDFRLHFDGVYPLGAYEEGLREAVLRMKRLNGEPLSLAIAQLMIQRRGEQIARFDPQVVVPVPMHWSRRLRRGVNNPEIVAACLSQQLKIPMARSLVRCRYTFPQKDLLPRERIQNVRGAFRIRHRDQTRWKGSRLLLVDDILTTGATCSEAARVLKDAGATAVAVAVVARAQGS